MPVADWGALERAQRERARTGATLTGHPLRLLGSQLRQWRAPGATDGAGHDLGMRPTPMHRLPAAGNALTIGLVTEYAERGYSRGRMATLTLEGSRGRLRGVIWDQVLTELHHRGAVPTVGRVVAVRGRITSGTRPRRPPRTMTTTRPVEQVPAREMMVSNVFPVDIDDRPGPGRRRPAPSITELWTARRTDAHAGTRSAAEPESPAAPRAGAGTGRPRSLRRIAPRLGADTPEIPQPTRPASAAPAARSLPARPPPGDQSRWCVDVLTLPAGDALRRACAEQSRPSRHCWPGTRSSPPRTRRRASGPPTPGPVRAAPPRTDTGCYLVVLITETGGATRRRHRHHGADRRPALRPTLSRTGCSPHTSTAWPRRRPPDAPGHPGEGPTAAVPAARAAPRTRTATTRSGPAGRRHAGDSGTAA